MMAKNLSIRSCQTEGAKYSAQMVDILMLAADQTLHMSQVAYPGFSSLSWFQ